MGATSQRRKRTLTTTVMSSLKIAVQNSQYAHIFVIAINHLDNTNGEDNARCISSYSLSIAMGHLDNGEGDGGLFLVLQQSFKEEFKQECKGEDNPVPGRKGHRRLPSTIHSTALTPFFQVLGSPVPGKRKQGVTFIGITLWK